MKKRILACLLCAALTAAPLSAAAAGEPVNLAPDKPYTIEKGINTDHSYSLYTEDGGTFDADSGQLTDGAKDGYYEAFRALSRTVTIDLGAVCSVTGYEATFYSASSSGIYVPRCISMAVSADGVQYMTVSENERSFSIFGTPNRTSTLGDTLDAPAAARYVHIEFPVEVFCYISEIEVYGFASLQGDEIPFQADEAADYPNAFYEKYAARATSSKSIMAITRPTNRWLTTRRTSCCRISPISTQTEGFRIRCSTLSPSFPATETTLRADGWSKPTADPAR